MINRALRHRALISSFSSAPQATIYGFHINSSISDPSNAVTYLADAIDMEPAYMDFTNNVFKYNDWADAFFMPRPCMLKYDGTVDYYLDPDDYTKKEDGITSSDVDNVNYQGNAMMQWGQNGKKIWYKIVPDVNDNTSASVYIADRQVDSNYHAWSFINNYGDMVDHFYTPIYNGTIIDGKLRSISGQQNTALCNNLTVTEEVAAAQANNQGEDKLWYTEVFSDNTLINFLLILIGKNLDTQTVFGNGRTGQTAIQDYEIESCLGTGTMNTNGLFWGFSNNTSYGVKVFGMENWWGNQWRRFAGLVCNNGTYKYKLTRGIQDGSTQDDYVISASATDYNGYLTAFTIDDTISGYISAEKFGLWGNIPIEANGSSSTYWCDNINTTISTTPRVARRGSYATATRGPSGAFVLQLNSGNGTKSWNIGASLSCKPSVPVIKPTIYGFHIDSSISDPTTAVTYLEDAVGMTPAHMDFTNNIFDYGDWENAFFMPRPCMLKYDGTVDYYLDPDDYTKRADGITASDVANIAYGGNAMMEWGRDEKKIWYKIVPDEEDNTSASIYIADQQVDNNYHAWSFINNQGNLVNHFYTPIYNGSIDSNGRLRSISEVVNTDLCNNKTATQEIVAAELNNLNTDKLWFTEVLSDITLINFLLVLISKTLNTQTAFGTGVGYISQSSASKLIAPGTMDTKGLFWGKNQAGYGVKIFGMEHWWGNQQRRFAGLIMFNGTYKYKLTYGTQDGSEQEGYISSTSGNDYSNYINGITIQTSFSTTTLAKQTYNNNIGLPSVSGDRDLYYTDYLNVTTGNLNVWYAIRSTGINAFKTQNDRSGAFSLTLALTISSSAYYVGAALSCKPLT